MEPPIPAAEQEAVARVLATFVNGRRQPPPPPVRYVYKTFHQLLIETLRQQNIHLREIRDTMRGTQTIPPMTKERFAEIAQQRNVTNNGGEQAERINIADFPLNLERGV
jgi:hypothetical protein